MRRGLQITLGVLSVIPLSFGLIGFLFGAEPRQGGVVSAELDSQFRFLSAWYVGLALLLWYIIPRVEVETALLRIAAFAIFAGGLGRVWSWMMIGPPPTQMIAGIVLELSVPLLLIWQARIRGQRLT